MRFFSKFNSISSAPFLSYAGWATLDPRHEVDGISRNILLRLARSQYKNSSNVRKLVKDMCLLSGKITPIVKSGDNEWDAIALEAFETWSKNPIAFDRSGKLTFEMSQAYLDRVSIIDGDAFAVFTRAENGMLQLVFYPGAQCQGEDQGIKQDEYGRARSYSFLNYRTGDTHDVPASAVLHYMQEKDPSGRRGDSELISVLGDSAGLRDIDDMNKKAIALATHFGLIETVDKESPAATSYFDNEARKRAAAQKKEGEDDLPSSTDTSFIVEGVNAVKLPPGHKLEVVADKRPSNEVQAFRQALLDGMAGGSGQNAEMINSPASLGSASVRFLLEKNRDWVEERLPIKKQYASAVWALWVSDAMSKGIIPRCKGNPFRVEWEKGRDKTIDVGRVTRSYLDLVFSGAMSMKKLAVIMGGGDWRNIINDNVEVLTYAREKAESQGLTLADILPGGFGYTMPWDPNKPLEVEQYKHEHETE